jgi:molybdate-binding protein/DNA-binding XRE family transcriptional regulator
MEDGRGFENDLRERRSRLGWTQHDLARRSGLSRTGIGAIESGRLIPSTAAALALARALECRVEDLFRLREPNPPANWAWPPARTSGRYWTAEVGGVVRLYPVEPSAQGLIPHDGTFGTDGLEPGEPADPRRTLVLATCDPAIGLLAAELARTSGIRVVALHRSSRAALQLLAQGLVHAVGLHLAGPGQPEGNATAVRETAGPGFSLLRLAEWEEGIASSPCTAITSARQALERDRVWVGREAGSGARQCLDELFEGGEPPARTARDHRGVAEAIRAGWAEVGVCHRLASDEAGLDFLPLRHEAHDLCFAQSTESDPRLEALVAAVRSPRLRRSLGELPGYDTRAAGEVVRVG